VNVPVPAFQICKFTCMHVHIYPCNCIHECTHIPVYIYALVFVCAFVLDIHIRICTGVYTFWCIHVFLYICTFCLLAY